MASTSSASGNGRVPWYRRLFGGGPKPAAAEPPPRRPSMMYYCAECRFGSKLRGAVYDHIKASHEDVLDRNGRIVEEPVPAS